MVFYTIIFPAISMARAISGRANGLSFAWKSAIRNIERMRPMVPIQVNVPYAMLQERVDQVVKNRIHPEIYVSAEDLDRYRVEEANHLAEVLHRNGLEITVHGPYLDLSPGGADPKVKAVTADRILKTIELARSFTPKTIIFHPGYDPWTFNGDMKRWLESSLQTWEPMVKEAEAAGLTLALENVFEEKPDSLRDLLEEIDSPSFRFCFDTGHHHVFSKAPLTFWVELLGRYLCETHLHDNHKEMDAHLPIGEGSFDFEQYFSLLSFYRLSPIYTIEPHEEAHLWRGLEAAKRYINVKSQNPNFK